MKPEFPGFWFNNLRQAALLMSSVEYDNILQICSTAAGYGELCVWFNQSEMGKYFKMNNL